MGKVPLDVCLPPANGHAKSPRHWPRIADPARPLCVQSVSAAAAGAETRKRLLEMGKKSAAKEHFRNVPKKEPWSGITGYLFRLKPIHPKGVHV